MTRLERAQRAVERARQRYAAAPDGRADEARAAMSRAELELRRLELAAARGPGRPRTGRGIGGRSITLRVRAEQRHAYDEAASAAGAESTAQWAIEILDRAIAGA